MRVRLSVTVRSLHTECVSAEGVDRDDARARIFDVVPDGFEVVTIGYIALEDSVRATAIVRSNETETLTADGRDLDEARSRACSGAPAEPAARGSAHHRRLIVRSGRADIEDGALQLHDLTVVKLEHRHHRLLDDGPLRSRVVGPVGSGDDAEGRGARVALEAQQPRSPVEPAHDGQPRSFVDRALDDAAGDLDDHAGPIAEPIRDGCPPEQIVLGNATLPASFVTAEDHRPAAAALDVDHTHPNASIVEERLPRDSHSVSRALRRARPGPSGRRATRQAWHTSNALPSAAPLTITMRARGR